MRKYETPTIKFDNELFESVYMASGDDCYSVQARIHQTPEIGRGDYRIQVDAVHAAFDKHHSTAQVLTISFNIPVTYKDSNGTLVAGNGTNSLVIEYAYHNNVKENIGLGDVIVEADAGLAVTGCILSCNHLCNQHQ